MTPPSGFPLRRLAAGLLLLELAWIAFLPPWEGFDETAHDSYLQQLTDTRHVPVLGRARLSQDVEAYATAAPMPYAATAPMEQNGGLTYRAFFAAPPGVVARGRATVHAAPARPRAYAPGRELNWQAQHPPLGYVLLAPLDALTRSWSWAARLLLLRGAACVIAWLAWLVALAAARRMRDVPGWGAASTWALLGAGLWPVLFPAWFGDMARLGNDPPCALIVAAMWLVCVDALAREFGWRHAVALGLLGGLGCLTKIFLLPIGLGTLAFWAARAGVRRSPALWPRLALAAALVAAIASPWYLWCRHEYGRALISAIDLEPGRGAMSLAAVDWPALARNLAGIVVSAAWTPTWSLARPASLWLVPLVVAIVLAACAVLRRVRRTGVAELATLPLWMTLPLLAGLAGGLVAKAAAGVQRGVGGYYLHVLVAPLSAALGVALVPAATSRAWRRLWIGLVIYAAAFGAVIQWTQVLMYAGIVFKAGASKWYQWPVLPPALGVPTALDRLQALAFPRLGAGLWVIGEALMLWGLAALPRFARASAAASGTSSDTASGTSSDTASGADRAPLHRP